VLRAFCDAMSPSSSPRPASRRRSYSTPTRAHLSLVGSLLLALLLGACQTDNIEEKTNRRLKRAQVFQLQGQYNAAILEATKAAQMAPERLDVRIQLAKIYNDLGRYHTTLAWLADLTNSADPEVILERATAYLALKKYRSAGQLLQSSSASYDGPQLSRFHLLVGQSLIGLGRVDEGRQFLQRASAGSMPIPAMLAIAQLDALMENRKNAERIITQLLGEEPENPDVLLLAGKIALYQGRLTSAEKYLTDALYELPITDIMLPERIQTLQMLSRVLTLLGSPHEAIAYNRVLSEKVPGYVETRNAILSNLALIEQGYLDEAEANLLSLLQAGGSDSAGALLGIVNFLQGDVSEASQLLSAHLDPETANSQALELLVSAKFQLNELNQVLSILGPEAHTRSDNAKLVGLYGLAKLARQDWSGIAHIEKSLQLEPQNSRLRLALSAFYQQKGNTAQALRETRLAYQHDPANQMVQGALLQQLILANKIAETRTITAEMAAANSENSGTQAMAGITFLRIEDHEAAWHHLRRAVDLDPESGTAWLALARLALIEQDYDAAATYFGYVTDILPHHAAGYKGLVNTWEAQGKPEQAIAALREIAKSKPDNGIPSAVLAEYYLLNEQFDEAQQHIEVALERLAGNSYIDDVATAIYAQAARSALREGDAAKSRDILIQGLSHLPNTPVLLVLLARTHIIDNKQDAALDITNTLETLMPATAWELRGDALLSSDSAAALDAYHQAWQLMPSSDIARKLYRQHAEISATSAEKFKAQWQIKLPNDPGLLFVSAIESREPGQHQAATRAYEALLEIEPNNVSVLNNLAWLYYENKDARALPLAKQAFELDPGNHIVLNTYGMVLIAQDEREQGVEMLRRAKQLAPTSEATKSHLEQADQH
jgi:tetratricopeptide (TPR) repeat protein